MTDNTSHTTGGGSSMSLALPAGIELGHYRLLHKIGQGGFGITYLAENLQSHEQVVIKENLPTFYASRNKDTLHVSPLDVANAEDDYAHTLERFVEEARTLARLHHPNIVRVYEAFEALGTAYYVMPYIPGKELHKAIPAVVDEAWLLPILRAVLEALEYLHSQNLLHRDLKPGNILLQDDGTPMLIDFGTARALQSERSATMVGTPGYTPIEQITPHGKRGPWTDLYALGATCYRVITGELPPEANERLAADEDPYRPLAKRAELRGRFSAELLQSIDTALAVRAKNRWQSAKDWLQRLPTATPQPTAEPSTRSLPVTPLATDAATPSRGKLLTAIITIGLLLLLPFFYGAYAVYQAAAQEAEFRRAEEVRAEAARLLQEEARLAQEKAAAELARNTELLTRVLAELQAALLQAQPLIPTAAKNVAEGQTPADQAPLQQQLNAMLPLAAQLQAYAAALTPEQRSAVCDSLPEEPQALRRYLTELCNHTSAAPSAEDILAILGWNEALSSAQEQKSAADRKAKEEAERLAKEKAEQAAKAAAERKAEKERKLCSYASDNDVESVKKLLAEGVDVNVADEDGGTPLLRAAGIGDTECVKLLLAAPGIDVNKADKDGRTPLYQAARNGHKGCVKLLKAAGAKK